MELRTTKTYPSVSISEERLALILLTGQSLLLGYAFALLYTVGSALFLLHFGSDFLPHTFVAIALIVPLFSFVFSALQKHWVLTKLSLLTTAFFTALFFVAWIGLSRPNAQWISFALIVGFTLGGLLCGIIRGAQAGYIFDPRKLKQMYPVIIGGEVFGVILGGVSSTFLPDFLGGVENVLLVAGGSMLLLLLLVLITTRRFRDALLQTKKVVHARKTKISHLLKNKYIALVFVYQILSTMGTRLANYLFMNQAEVYYKTPELLTSFFGVLMAVATVLTLLFVIFLSGKLLTRFGMSLGLAGNPVGVGIAIVGASIVGTIFGSGVLPFFILIMCAGLFDVILTAGLTDTTIQSSYQPLPPGERTAVQTLVEGVGIPIAFGLSGLCLLLFNSIEALNLIHVVYLTFFLTVLWTGAGILLYRNYGEKLKQSMKHRFLDQTAFSLADKSSLEVVEKLLQSSESKEVCLALEFLEKAEHPSLNNHLIEALRHKDPEVRKTALSSIERIKVEDALPEIDRLLKVETETDVRSGTVRALCALKTDDIEEVLPYLEDEDQEVRTSALVGLFRYGGIGGVLAAVDQFNEMTASQDVARRILLARVLGEISVSNFYQPLVPLLSDESLAVRKEALLSAGKIANPGLWPLVIENLKITETRSAAMSALMAAGDDILPIFEDSLGGRRSYNKDTLIRLIRVCSQSRNDKVIKLFKGLIDYNDPDIQLEILKSLNRCGYKASNEDQVSVEKVLLDQAKQALQVLLSKEDLEDNKAFDLLKTALTDEFVMILKRIFLLLSFLYDAPAIMGAERNLLSGIKTQVGLALELLDVTLSKELKGYIFPLLDENTPLEKRIHELKTLLNLRNMGQSDRLREIITDAETRRMGWTSICGIYAAALLGLRDLVGVIESAIGRSDFIVRETAAWALFKLDPDTYHKYSDALLMDPNPRIAELAARFQKHFK